MTQKVTVNFPKIKSYGKSFTLFWNYFMLGGWTWGQQQTRLEMET
jgi:hypothetical protein